MRGMERAYDIDRYVTDETRPGILSRFETKFKKSNGGCWDWTVSKGEWGYGRFRLGSRCDPRFPRIGVGANRMSFVLYSGPVGSMCVLHKCDNPGCVNPSHLYLGTFKDSLDQAVRNRFNHPVGARNHASKLTVEDVLAIRSSAESDTVLARRYGVHVHTIGNVRARRNWRHVP